MSVIHNGFSIPSTKYEFGGLYPLPKMSESKASSLNFDFFTAQYCLGWHDIKCIANKKNVVS